MRSTRTGQIRERTMRNAAGTEIPAILKETVVLDDPEAMCRAALLGLGVTLIAVPHALPHLEKRALMTLGAAVVRRCWTDLDLLSRPEHCSPPRPAYSSTLSLLAFAVIA